MKTILVALHNPESLDQTLSVVCELARQHDSHVIGYYPIPSEDYLAMPAPDALIPFSNALKVRAEKNLPTVQRTFRARMKTEGVSAEFQIDKMDTIRMISGVITHGRTTDLIVLQIGEYNGKITSDFAGEVADVAMESGRPVLAIPPKLKRPFSLEHATLAWNASRESARAAFDSVELLKTAKSVDVLWVNPEDDVDRDVQLPGAEIANVLARHDIAVESRSVDTRSSARKVIVEHAQASASDLLVIGAYGRSRLRERILGGVTEHVLRHPPCCVLLSN